MSKFKISVAAVFVALAFVGGMLGSTADAAATKVFRNSESNFAVTIPSDWGNKKQGEMDILSSLDNKLLIIALSQAVPRDDSYGKYMLDEASNAEKAIIMEEMKKGFLETSAPGVSITQSEYVRLASGHNAIVMMIEGAANGPMLGMAIIRDREAILLIGATDSAVTFTQNSKFLAGIMATLKAE